MKEIKKVLAETKVEHVPTREAVVVDQSTPLFKVVALMKEQKTGCALITEQGALAGILTERDLMVKAYEQKLSFKVAVKDIMTRNPKTLSIKSSLTEAILVMNKGLFRHLPLVNESGAVEGMVSVRDVIRYLASLFPYAVYNLPPDPQQIAKTPAGA